MKVLMLSILGQAQLRLLSLSSRGPEFWISHWYNGKDDGTFLQGHTVDGGLV